MNGIIPLTLHMCTIKDFYNFCKKRNIKLDKSLALHNEKISSINETKS